MVSQGLGWALLNGLIICGPFRWTCMDFESLLARYSRAELRWDWVTVTTRLQDPQVAATDAGGRLGAGQAYRIDGQGEGASERASGWSRRRVPTHNSSSPSRRLPQLLRELRPEWHQGRPGRTRARRLHLQRSGSSHRNTDFYALLPLTTFDAIWAGPEFLAALVLSNISGGIDLLDAGISLFALSIVLELNVVSGPRKISCSLYLGKSLSMDKRNQLHIQRTPLDVAVLCSGQSYVLVFLLISFRIGVVTWRQERSQAWSMRSVILCCTWRAFR